MPKDFEDCVKRGGYIRTKKLPGGKYIHICFDDRGSHAGEIKVKKKKKK